MRRELFTMREIRGDRGEDTVHVVILDLTCGHCPPKPLDDAYRPTARARCFPTSSSCWRRTADRGGPAYGFAGGGSSREGEVDRLGAARAAAEWPSRRMTSKCCECLVMMLFSIVYVPYRCLVARPYYDMNVIFSTHLFACHCLLL